ncbi:MAG TPA: PAS domain S-box protein, partial [Verrucomicrobiae bacterium]
MSKEAAKVRLPSVTVARSVRPRIHKRRWAESSRDELKAQHGAVLSAQAELEASRARYAELYDAAPVGYVTLSRTGMIEQLNLTGAGLLGIARTHAINQPLMAFVVPQDRRKYLKFLSQLRRCLAQASVQVELERKKNGPVFVEIIATRAGLAEEGGMRFQCALVDITARRQTEEELRASEERFRTLANHAPVGIFQAGEDGGITYANDSWCGLTDLPAEVVHGHGWLQAIHGDDRERVSIAWNESVAARRTFAAEFRFQHASGKVVWVQAKAVCLKNADGDVAGYIGTIADITESKLADEASQRLAAIVQSSDDAIVGKDLNGIITSWNRGAEKIFGYKADEVIGKSILAVIPEDRQDEEDEILRRVRNGNGVDHFETVRRHKSGRLLEMSLTVSPVRDARGKIVGASKIGRDITERKRAERELQQAHASALAASRAKDDLLAMLSHELRTPLNPVLLLASEWARHRELPPRVRADFDAIRKNIELEARLIDDMLDMTRLSRGKLLLHLEPVHLHTVLRDAITTVQAEVKQKKIALVSNLRAPKCVVFGDAVRLQQIFWNVLKNAVKFTPAEGMISVETALTDAAVTVRINDTGIGMTGEEIQRAFEAFSQGKHVGYGGLGLGLAISQKLIELHHGSIHAQSEGKGRGATFII